MPTHLRFVRFTFSFKIWIRIAKNAMHPTNAAATGHSANPKSGRVQLLRIRKMHITLCAVMRRL